MSDLPSVLHPVATPDAPAPGGHYSQAVVHGRLVYISGQLPVAPFEVQARRASPTSSPSLRRAVRPGAC